jgi:hypothetical protein
MLCLAGVTAAYGAVGCSLNDPDRDIRRIFPDATGYRTEYITIDERGGDSLATEIEARLRDKFDDMYETTDVPYAYYDVLKGKDVVGRVHGVNQKGKFGGMQLIVATDLEGTIVDFYYQKISSPEAKRFRSKEFTDQFKGLSLTDFYTYTHMSGEARAKGSVAGIADPSEKSGEDFEATLRGITKNLILLDEFKLDNIFHKRFREETKATARGPEVVEPDEGHDPQDPLKLDDESKEKTDEDADN